jgi:cytochrome P450
MQSPPGNQVPPPGCPAHGSRQRVRLYGEDFAANPHAFYEHLRQGGLIGPVELAPGVEAGLVTDYRTALYILQNPGSFARDSRRWRALNEGQVPLDSPVLPMMAYRPNALFSDGAEHLRLRQSVTDSLARVDTHRLRRHVDQVAAYLIDQFNGRGRADLVADYAQQLPLLVFNDLFGCPADIGDRIVFGISGIFEGSDAENANRILTESLLELIALKRRAPGEDVTTWLMQHEARLSDEEMIHQLVTLLAAGTEPLQNLISSMLWLLLSEEKYGGGQHAASLLVEDALYDVLWNHAPIANYGVHYPVHDVEVGGAKLSAGDPVVISFAAANTDPSLAASRQTLSKRAHLAWGAGPHVCPAKDPAILISIIAVEKLLNRLHDVDLDSPVDELTWRPGMFHRSLLALPARFTPEQQRRRDTGSQAGQPVGSAPNQPPKKTRWSAFLDWLTG